MNMNPFPDFESARRRRRARRAPQPIPAWVAVLGGLLALVGLGALSMHDELTECRIAASQQPTAERSPK